MLNLLIPINFQNWLQIFDHYKIGTDYHNPDKDTEKETSSY